MKLVASCLPSLLFFFLFLLTTGTVHSLPTFFPRAPQQSLIKSAKDPELPYSTHFFPQQLDHFTFRPNADNVFHQKYLMNSTFWDRGPVHTAPIFVYTGNEGNIEWFASNTGFMMDIAPRFNALLVFIEHRFYGDSLPFGKESKSAEELGYLTSTQALADYAVLIRSLKKNLSAEASPVVVFGGSYGGSKLITALNLLDSAAWPAVCDRGPHVNIPLSTSISVADQKNRRTNRIVPRDLRTQTANQILFP